MLRLPRFVEVTSTMTVYAEMVRALAMEEWAVERNLLLYEVTTVYKNDTKVCATAFW